MSSGNIEDALPGMEELMNQLGGNDFQEQMKDMMGKMKEVFKIDNDQDFPIPDFSQMGELMKTMLPQKGEKGLEIINHLKDLYKEGKTFNIYYEDDNKLSVCKYEPAREYPEGKYFVMDGKAYNIKETNFFFEMLKMQKDGKWFNHVLENISPLYALEFTNYFRENEIPPRAFNDLKECLNVSGSLNKVNLLDEFEGKEKLLENVNFFLASQAVIFEE
jgi:hypothetical protein